MYKIFSSVWIVFSFRLDFSFTFWKLLLSCFSLFLIPLILMLFLKHSCCEVALPLPSAWHCRGPHRLFALTVWGCVLLGHLPSWWRTACVPLLAVSWGQGIYFSSHFICSLQERGGGKTLDALCRLCCRFPIPVALLRPGMDVSCARLALSSGGRVFVEDYLALRMGPQGRTEAWNISPLSFLLISTCYLQQLFPPL